MSSHVSYNMLIRMTQYILLHVMDKLQQEAHVLWYW